MISIHAAGGTILQCHQQCSTVKLSIALIAHLSVQHATVTRDNNK